MPGSRSDLPVVLVAMPFLEVYRPSIQIGLLASIAAAHGYPVRTLHAHLDMAAAIGVDLYQRLSEHRGKLLGEWLFSVEAFGDAAPDPAGRHATELAGDLADQALHLRQSVIPGYLDALAAAPDWAAARVVGFTSTFQQNTASIALARRLKRRHPHLVTVFGGANFEGEMGPEYVRALDGIDFAVVGEGDTAFPALLDALATGDGLDRVPGLARRTGGEVTVTAAEPPGDTLGEPPAPDYTEYFDRAARLGLLGAADRAEVAIPFESSRGCWWGERHHCTFCGLNGATMRFRAKPAGRVLDELARQAGAYGSFRFDAVDNILDMRYLTDLMPRLADYDFDLFYEVKSNLTRAQLETLARAGVRRVQPGIESLSSRVLTLMRKGVRAAQNVNFLRWAQHYGIRVEWNLLWGFPGEAAEDYTGQAAAMPHLVHLRPPAAAGRVWMERFSPLFQAAEVARRTPERSYGYVYPRGVDLDRVAYFFEYEWADPLPDATYDGVRDGIAAWQAAWERQPALTYRAAPGLIRIDDQRHPGSTGTYTFRGRLAEIYLACSERPASAAAVARRLGLPEGYAEDAFREFAHRGLMFADDDRSVSLALPAGPPP